MAADGSLRASAPAKVNLGLHVLAKRGDGYHEIDTLLVKLVLADELMVAPAEGGIDGYVELPDGPGFREPLRMDASNLAVRAARLYLDAIGQRSGATIRLVKRIPVAAGLGGGSSDAAAVLRMVARLFPAEVDLVPLALELGSDVPFFLQAASAARARGRGERLTPIEVPKTHLVLANPGVSITAAEAYARLQNFTPRLDPDAVARALSAGEEPRLRNALQPGVMLAYPEVREVLMALRGHDLMSASMSGSGATCFGIARSEDAAARVASELAREHPHWWVASTRTL